MALSQIIVTSRYLKSGNQKSKNKRRNYTKYIAIRETVEMREQNTIDRNNNATQNQQELLSDLLSDFPEAKRYLEYEDYKNNPTAENASELISTIIERNADVIGNRQNFVGYMAMRPGVEKRGAHGLFNESDEPIVLDRAANEIANHPGNVWSHVVSLRREDAIRLGYDNSERWRELVMRHIADIAEQTKIPLCNLKWYAAFHDTTHHPHIHLLVYSKNPKQGFLTKQGIDKIRSVFANDIFHDDLQSIYMEQTIRRDELKMESKKYVEELLKKIRENNFHNAKLESLIFTLKKQLDSTNGKKVYGYLKPEVKTTVDEVFKILSQEKNISELYEKWCELERQKYKTYTQKEKEFPPLWENKVFQPVRNMIVQQVLNIQFLVEAIEVAEPELPESFTETEIEIPPQIDTDFFKPKEPADSNLKWNDNYKTAYGMIHDKRSELQDYLQAELLLLSEAESGNALAMFELGKLYAAEKLGKKDAEKSFEFYRKALQGFLKIEPIAKKLKPFLQFRIGQMYRNGFGTDVDIPKAITYFQQSAEHGNVHAKRIIALEYISGEFLEQDIDKGISILTECADSGDKLFCYWIGKIYLDGKITAQDLDKAEKYLLAADKNEYTFYALGKLYLTEEKRDVQRSVSYFEQCSDTNPWASYWLGKIYLFGCSDVQQNREKALDYLTFSAEQGNEYAQNLIDHETEYENVMLTNTIFSLFANLSKCISEDYNQKFQSGRLSVDKKLRRMILEKKQALGLKEEHSQTHEQSY